MAPSPVPSAPEPETTGTQDQQQMSAGWPFARIGAATVVAAILLWSMLAGDISIVLLFTPVILGSVLVAIDSDALTSKVEQCEGLFENRADRARTKEGKFARYFSRPLWGGSRLLWRKTESIRNRGLRAGLRLTAITYFFGIMIAAFVFVAYATIAILIFIAVLLIGLWLLGKFLGGEDEQNSRLTEAAKNRTRSQLLRTRPVGDTSMHANGVFDPRVEHFENGVKIAESRERHGVFGAYVETTDMKGNKIGESREVAGVFGDYTRHTDQRGEEVGETEQGDGVFEPYAVHTDEHGEKIGETRVHEGILDDHAKYDDKKRK